MLWRGGYPIKSQPRETVLKSAKGANHDNESAKHFQEVPIMEKDEDEASPFESYDPITQTLDLPLKFAVLQFSFPPLPSNLHDSTMNCLPQLLSQRIVVALVCSDSVVRVLTIPLIPPSPQIKARGDTKDQAYSRKSAFGPFGEQLVVVSGATGHQSIPKGVSITATVRGVRSNEGVNAQEEANSSKPQSPSLDLATSDIRGDIFPSTHTIHEWDLLVASHSADFNGLLLIHRLALTRECARIEAVSAEHSFPWRIEHLASPVISIQFNSSVYPAPTHSELLLAEAKGAVRVLDCLGARESQPEGKWLTSLFPPFQTSPDSLCYRKPILDAQWCLCGKAILVLLADGEWGVWDLKHTGPRARRGAEITPGITGSLLTVFAISGWINPSRTVKSALRKTLTLDEGSRGLAPMTPSTRKLRQENLFAETVTPSNILTHGGISVTPTNNISDQEAADEAVLLWREDGIIIFPSLLTYWQEKVKGGGTLFGTHTRAHLRCLGTTFPQGEVRQEVSLFPESYQPRAKSALPAPHNILITGERSLIIMAPPSQERRLQDPLEQLETASSRDQHLLASGELDINGMERILAGMSDEVQNYSDHCNGASSVKKVGFLDIQ